MARLQPTSMRRDDSFQTSNMNRDDALPAEQQPSNLWLIDKKSDDQDYFAKVLKTSQNDNLLELWDEKRKPAKLLARLCCHNFEIKEILFAPNDKSLVVADERTLIVWNWFEHKKWIAPEAYDQIQEIKFLDEGTSLEWSHQNGRGNLLNIHTGLMRPTQIDNSGIVTSRLKTQP